MQFLTFLGNVIRPSKAFSDIRSQLGPEGQLFIACAFHCLIYQEIIQEDGVCEY